MIANQPFLSELMQWLQSYAGRVFTEFSVLIGLALEVISLIALWKIFTKAGKPGWAALVPIYNQYVLLQIVGASWWWLLGLMLPVVRLIVRVFLCLDLARAFGKGTGFALGLIFLSKVFIPLLGFGDSRYIPPLEKSSPVKPAI
jgi:hypothetical protein